jgi:hypothetical protein
MGALLLVEDDDLSSGAGSLVEAEYEPVELSSGNAKVPCIRWGSGGDDEERRGHRIGRAVDRRLAPMHPSRADWVLGSPG